MLSQLALKGLSLTAFLTVATQPASANIQNEWLKEHNKMKAHSARCWDLINNAHFHSDRKLDYSGAPYEIAILDKGELEVVWVNPVTPVRDRYIECRKNDHHWATKRPLGEIFESHGTQYQTTVKTFLLSDIRKIIYIMENHMYIGMFRLKEASYSFGGRQPWLSLF